MLVDIAVSTYHDKCILTNTLLCLLCRYTEGRAFFMKGKRFMKDYTKGICVECGAIYNETQYSFLCPECRKRHLSENAIKNNLSKLGHQARKRKGDE